MSKWTHPICEKCWNIREPTRRPSVMVPAEEEICCVCNQVTNSGIYVRGDPEKMPCQGVHTDGVKQ